MSEDRPVALVTGGSDGVGEAVVARLTADGFNVAYCPGPGSAVGTTISDATEDVTVAGARVLTHSADLTEPKAARGLVKAAEAELGPLAAVVTCGDVGREGPWEEVAATNLDTTFHVCRSAVFSFMKRRTGRVVTLAAAEGVAAGVTGFTLSLAKECAGFGVRANVVVPGRTGTPGQTADLVALLLSERSEHLSGQVLAGP